MQYVVTQPPALHGTIFEILDQHIAALSQPPDNFLTLRFAHVEHDVAFVAVDRHEISALAFDKGRAIVAGFVSAGRFYLYYFGAVVAQHHTAEGSSQHPAQIQYS